MQCKEDMEEKRHTRYFYTSSFHKENYIQFSINILSSIEQTNAIKLQTSIIPGRSHS